MRISVSEEWRQELENGTLKGLVHSTYKNTINIRNKEKFFSFIITPNNQYPGSACFTEQAIWWNQIKQGDLLWLNVDGLYLNMRKISDFQGIQYYSSAFEKIKVTVGKEEILEVRKGIGAFILHYGATGGIAGLLRYAKKCREPIPENMYVSLLRERLNVLLCGLHQRDWENVGKAVGRFVGCGAGLTPSSDDFLCGFLCVIQYYLRIEDDVEWQKRVEEAVKTNISGKTTAVSCKYLMESAEGYYTLVMRRLIQAIFHKKKDLEKLLFAELQVGSTSGTDTLTGVCFGLEYILDEKEGK
ncbi:MAG: DUF2877 domain-containing protein [Roseburia sp.]|nr:DUF2877 domain-containing protein [Roseburia sp.]